MKKFILAAFAVMVFAVAYGLEIPLESTKGGENFGFVDVQKLFESYPKVLEAKQSCEKAKIEKRGQEIKIEKDIEMLNTDVSGLDKKINILKDMLPLSTTSARGIAVQIDTGAVNMQTVVSSHPIVSIATSSPTVPHMFEPSKYTDINIQISSFTAQIMDKKIKIENKTKELEEIRAKYEKEICDFEDSKTQLIMADFYKVISEVAKEENISVVVDKSSILYGLPGIDLTEKVIDRLRGK